MPVVSTKELGRTFDAEIGKPSVLKRRWICVLSDDTLTGTPVTEDEIVAATGVGTWGTAHPLRAWFVLRKYSIREGFDGSPYHVEVTAEYGPMRAAELQAPSARPAEWSAEATQGEYPALFYYDSGTTKPMTNSANDYFPGLTTTESIVRATVKKNFSSWPSAWFAANNCVNSDSYLGCPQHTLRVNGITANLAFEEQSGGTVAYYEATATLLYRESGHNLQLPDIGFNFIDGGQKRRAMVFDFQNSEWVPSPNPVALNGSGGLASGAPSILDRRVCPEANFGGLFGASP
jgi:hypothetical protein